MSLLYKALKIGFIISLLVRSLIIRLTDGVTSSLGSLPGLDVPAEPEEVPGQGGAGRGDQSAPRQGGSPHPGAGLHPRHHLLSVQRQQVGHLASQSGGVGCD